VKYPEKLALSQANLSAAFLWWLKKSFTQRNKEGHETTIDYQTNLLCTLYFFVALLWNIPPLSNSLNIF